MTQTNLLPARDDDGADVEKKAWAFNVTGAGGVVGS